MAERIKKQNCVNCPSKSAFYCKLEKEEIKYLDNTRYEVEFEKDEIILKQGTIATHMICLTTGKAKMYLEGDNSKNLIISIINPGELFGGPGSYFKKMHHVSVRAIEKCKVCFISLEEYQEVVSSRPDLANYVIGNVSEKALRLIHKVSTMAFKKVNGRFAESLLYLHKIYNEQPITLSRSDIADLAAITRETVSRIIKQWTDEGIIEVKGNYIYIKELEKIKQISDNG